MEGFLFINTAEITNVLPLVVSIISYFAELTIQRDNNVRLCNSFLNSIIETVLIEEGDTFKSLHAKFKIRSNKSSWNPDAIWLLNVIKFGFAFGFI